MFEKFDIAHAGLLSEAVSARGFLSCQLSAAGLYCYAEKYNTEICVHNGFIFIRQKRDKYPVCYFMPIAIAESTDASALADAIACLYEYDRSKGHNNPFTIWGVADDMSDMFSTAAETAGIRGTLVPDRDWAEYVHTPENLIDMKGKRFHAKKNAVNQFIRNNSDFHYAALDASNIDEVTWFQERLMCGVRKFDPDENAVATLNMEHSAIMRGLSNYEALGMSGGIIRIDGEISAFAFGGDVTPFTFDLLFEKALKSYNGIFQVMEQEMLKNNVSGYKYINREEDLGEANLRFAKERLRPDILLGKSVFHAE